MLPGMQAAFVDIGLERAAFLHVSDLNASDREKAVNDEIELAFHEGQEVVVQVVKDPIGTKGARLTTEISIPSVYQVYMPYAKVSGVSQRIECEGERARLRTCVEVFQRDHSTGGFIARTAAEGVDEAALRADMLFLQKLWNSVAQRIKTVRVKTLLHEDLPLGMRVLRDLHRSKVEKIRVDSRETYSRLLKFAKEFVPETVPLDRALFRRTSTVRPIRCRGGNSTRPGAQGRAQIGRLHDLRSDRGDDDGGRQYRCLRRRPQSRRNHLQDQPGGGAGHCPPTRLRNLGGIIIIDFIDMQDEEHKHQVLQALEKSLEKDHAKNTISEVSSLGLVEMTRKRTRESLEHILCEPCPCCGGRGVLKTAETTCLEIFREIIREVRQYNVQELLVLASNEVVERLLDEEADMLSELESFLGVSVKFRAEAQYSQEQYDVVLL